MSSSRHALLVALLLGTLARAHGASLVAGPQAASPEAGPQARGSPVPAPGAPAVGGEGEAVPQEWEPYPEEGEASSPAAPEGRPGASTPVGSPRRAPPPPRPEDFNRVSLFGGQALGSGKRALAVFLGFPLLGARAAVGLLPWLDVGAGFESFYGVMNDLHAFARVNVLQSGRWDLALVLEGSRAFFTQWPQVEDRGARWLTGRRNWNLLPGVLLSLRAATPQGARLFADVRYHLAVDTEPFQEDPLGGLPDGLEYVHNVPIRFGAELPFSPVTSFLANFGFDFHTHRRDAPFMPVIGVGVVTAF